MKIEKSWDSNLQRDLDEDCRDFDRPKRRFIRCSDRMCGALDCPTCYPLTYQQSTDDESLERERYQESNCSPPHLNKDL